MTSLPLYVAVVATFFLVASAEESAQSILVTTTVNKTSCTTTSNIGDFYHYGAAVAAKGNSISAIQYEGKNTSCCSFDLANEANMTIDIVSASAGTTPCSNLEECQ